MAGEAKSIRESILAAHPALGCVETRQSWIFLSGEEAWKIRKPAPDQKVDEKEVRAQRAACELEIARGRLHAGEIYHGVVSVAPDEEGAIRLGGGGRPVGWAIHMRRLPESDRADLRLADNRLGDEHMRWIADHVASVHARSIVSAHESAFSTPEAIALRVGWAFGRGDALSSSDDESTAEGIREIEAWQRRFIEQNADLVRARHRAGRVRDGHGDLCLENLFLDDDGSVSVVDGAKRSTRFRMADVAADVATLSLDLTVHHRVDLAERFIAAYAYAANDFDVYSVVGFYESCRANLEAKTAERMQHDPDIEPPLRARAADRTNRYTRAALAVERRPFLPPMVVALSGLVATGKSSVAAAIAHQIAAAIVSSDETRDFMLFGRIEETNVSVHEMDWERGFHPGFREEVYNEVFRRAEVVLASGRPVVVDGCFGLKELRARARDLANRYDAPFFFVECTAIEQVVRERLAARSLRDGVPIETWMEISEDFRALWQPVDELPEAEHVVLKTDQPIEVSVETLEARLPVWPESFQ
ncbi:MAG: AAA family ATPase [bacterium]|nr:AAA family ATPase [bacterium]